MSDLLARTLRHMAVASVAFGITAWQFGAPAVNAQGRSPSPSKAPLGWELRKLQPVTPEEAKRHQTARRFAPSGILRKGTPGAQLQTLSAPTQGGVAGPASIAELARALRHDVDLIYEYVHNNIEFTPTYGALKGAVGTIMDGRAGAYDQAALMVDLLRASGYTANFVFGEIALNATQLQSLLGANGATSGEILGGAWQALVQGGVPVNQTITTTVNFSHAWVQVDINGTNYVFDPAVKTTIATNGIDIGAVVGYSRTSLLANAKSGPSFVQTADYIQNLNQTSLRSTLTGYASALVDHIRTNIPGAALNDVLGGRTIVPVTGQLRQTSLAYQVGTPTVAAAVPNGARTTLDISHLGAVYQFFADEIYGKRLTVTYNPANGNRPWIKVDGTVAATGTTAVSAGSFNPITVTIEHPNAQLDQTRDMFVRAGGTYFIVNGWDGTGRAMVDLHRRRLAETRAAPGATETSEAVLGESLGVMGFQWLAEMERATRISDRIYNMSSVYAHVLGVAGHDGSTTYVDLPAWIIGTAPLNNALGRFGPAFYNLGGIGSTVEAGTVRQTGGITATSTTTLFDVANSQGIKIFDATAVNWASVSSQLIGYDATTLSNLSNSINASPGHRIVLPSSGAIPVGASTSQAYMDIDDQIASNGTGTISIYYSINNLKGGFGADLLSEFEFNNSTLFSPYQQSSPVSGGWLPSLSQWFSATVDPVNLFTGDYFYNHDDITVGSAAHPFGLGFQRSYTSGGSLRKGPLGFGWSHNFAISAQAGSDPFQGLGEDSPIDAAAAIVGMYVSLDFMTLQSGETLLPLDRLVISALVQSWVMDNLTDNSVTVVQPQNTQQFVKLADGTFNPPPGSASALAVVSSNYQLRSPQGITLTFDAANDNKISTWKDPHNNTVSFNYTSGRLTSVGNGMGRTLTLAYNGDLISQVSDGTGRSISYGYDSAGNLTSFTDADGKITTMAYDTANRLTQMFYPANPSIAFMTNTYDSLGRVKEQLDAHSNLTTLYLAGYRSEQVDALGNSHVYYYNPRGRVLREVNELGQAADNEYDGQDRLIKKTLPEGNSIEFAYDTRHNPITVTTNPKTGSSEVPIVQSSIYEANFSKVTSTTDALGRTTTFSIDPANGNVLQISQPQVGGQTPVQTFTYNSRGQVLTRTDQTGKVTEYEYDPANGNLLKVTEDKGVGRLNLETQFGYSSAGNVTSTIDPRGNTTTLAYDPERRVAQTTTPAPFNLVTKTTYNADGNVVKIERQSSVPAGTWQTTTFTYTASGKRATAVDPSSHTTLYEYDQLDRLKKVTDAESRVTQFQYDALGRPYRVIDPLSQIREEYAYTPNGRRQSLKDANLNETTWEYDAFDRNSRVVYVDDSYEEFTYDTAGNVLTKRTRAGQIIGFTYDPLNRLSTKSPSGLPTVTYAYDLAGRTTSVSDSGGAFTYGYDTAGRNTSVTRPDSKVVSYQYDAAGNRTRMTWPDAFYVTYAYDELNRMTQVRQNGTTLLAQYAWDALSRRSMLTFGNNTKATYSYAANDDLQQIVHQFKTSSVTFGYTYNQVGQKASTNLTDDRFLYRPAANDNLSYTANALNQYTAVGAATITHDSNGNLTSDGVNTYTYDSENRLVTAVTPTRNASYVYDPLGRRASKTVDGVTTGYLHDGNQEIAEYSGAGALQRRYIYGIGIDEPLLQILSTGTKFYYRIDGVGSIVAHEEHASGFVQRFAYGPYGEATVSTGHPFRYTGRRLDEETGLYYYRARYYSPTLGRFLQVDPIGYQGGLNLYAYVGNDPLNFNDPLGLFAGELASNSYNMIKNDPLGSAIAVGSFALDFVPVIGDLKGFYEAYQDPTFINIAAAVVGVVPVAGDAVGKSLKLGDKAVDFYRGARPGELPSFTPRSNEFKVDPGTGFVKETHGVSVYDNPQSVSSRGWVPHQVDQGTLPDSLRIIQRGNDRHHFEIVPKPGANLTPQEFIRACNSIQCSR